jgi:hypothetical protein
MLNGAAHQNIAPKCADLFAKCKRKIIKLHYKFINMSVVLIKKDAPKKSSLRTEAISTAKKTTVKKSAFEMECEKGFTIEQSRKRIHDKIDTLWKK